MKTTITSIFTNSIGKAFLFAIGLLTPIKFIMMIVFFAILADTIYGVRCSKKIGEQITSRKLSKFITKLLIYQAVIIFAYAIDVNIFGEFLLLFLSVPMALTKVVALGLIVNEGYSIDESLKRVNKEKGLWFYFKQLIGLAKMIKSETKDLK